MTSSASSEDDVFERLKRQNDPEVSSEREKAVAERVRAQYERAQQRLAELINENSTLPVTIADIRVHGIKNTRNGFLQKVLAPALAAEKQEGYTLKTAMDELQRTTDRLHRLGIFHPTINMYLDQAKAEGGRTPLSAILSVSERSRYTIKTGTELGNHEGGGYLNATIRNLFGGAESLCASASTATSTADVGARTRSSYDVTFSTPLFANPDTVLELGGFAAGRSNHYYASHEEIVRGMRGGLKFLTGYGEHEVAYHAVWRQITNLSPTASLSVRNDAGDTVKSAVSHTITRDFRNNKLLATSGYHWKNRTEVSGFGGLGGDVSFLKNEFEASRAIPLPYGISISAGLRCGVMYPLPLGLSDDQQPPQASRINDRFFLGGTTDIRGFRENGIGPHDGLDSVGGDVYAAGGASIFFPLPRLGPEYPFRIQAFVNGGRLVALQGIGEERGGDAQRSVANALKELGNRYPSVAAGVGLVYAHQVARFELNVALPVFKMADERTRKGLQFGVGISFL